MLPLISCLTVSLPVPERIPMLRRCLNSYRRQSYPNRELVLVLNGGDPATLGIMIDETAARNDPSIRVVVPAAQALSLGALRNISLAEAHGSLVCQWDDDDLYHPRRLAEQARLFNESGCTAVFLRDVFQFVSTTRELFGTNWHATETGGFPGSLMCRHASAIRYPESGTDAALGEDRVVARQLLAAGGVQTLDECPWLFVYVSHGCNSWPDSHHRMLIERLAMSRGLLIRREASIREGLSRVDFGAVAVTVQGSNGPAFTIEGYTEISSS